MQNARAPDLHRPGEPQLRSLLRDLPGRRRHPDEPRRLVRGRASRIRTRRARACRRTVTSSFEFDGGPHTHSAAVARRATAARWTGSSTSLHPDAGLRAGSMPDQPQCHGPLGTRGAARRDEHAHAREKIPNYWAYADHFTLAGPHVRPGGFVDAALAPVPGVGLVGRTARHDRPDELPQRHQPARATTGGTTARRRSTRGPTSRGCSTRTTSPGATTSATTRAGSTRRATTRRDARTPRATTATCSRVHELLGRRARRGAPTTCARSTSTWRPPPTASLPAGGVDLPDVGHERAPDERVDDPAPGMAYVTRLVNAAMQGPGLGLHRDLPDVGRLGRVLRPRRPAAGRRQRVRAARARPRDQPVGASRRRSTTRTLSFDSYLRLIEDRFVGGAAPRPDDRRAAGCPPDRPRTDREPARQGVRLLAAAAAAARAEPVAVARPRALDLVRHPVASP